MCMGGGSSPSYAPPPAATPIQAQAPQRPTGSLIDTGSAADAQAAAARAGQSGVATPQTGALSPNATDGMGAPRNPMLVKTLDKRDAFNASPEQVAKRDRALKRREFDASLSNSGSFLGSRF